MVIDSIVGEFYLWEDIKTMKLSELTTYVGVVHCLSSKEELDALSDKMLLSYSCDKCLSCTYLKKTVAQGQKQESSCRFKQSKLYSDLSQRNIEKSFACSLPKRYFAMGQAHE
jgi:hypothetical protein